MGQPRDRVIETLYIALAAAGHTMRSASIAIGLNHSYLSKFMRKDGYSPDVLPEDIRLALARLLDIDQNLIKVNPIGGAIVKDRDGISSYGIRAPRTGAGRRTTEMRVDHIIEELGRIKERLDRLEGRGGAAAPGKGDKPPRP